jgi:hypothetical protein
MAKTADADDSDAIRGADTKFKDGTEDRDSAAEERSGADRRE